MKIIVFLLIFRLKVGIINEPNLKETCIPNQILIKFKNNVEEKEFFERKKLVPLRKSLYGDFWTCYFEGDLQRVLKDLKSEPCVLYVQPNFKWYILENTIWIPNDPYLSYQWHFPKIRLFEAWDIEQGGKPYIIVGLLDTGCAYEDFPVPIYEREEIHPSCSLYKRAPDFNLANFIPGYDFVHNDFHPNDDHGHGTFVAGTIIESTNNGIGVAGIAFNVTLMPIKVINSLGWGGTDWVTDGVYYAATHGCDILNMSIASYQDPGPIFYEAIQYAYSQGVIMVAGAGNTSGNLPAFPAAYKEVIGVGATNSADSLAFYSNYGDTIDVVAPGGDLVDRDGNGFPDLVVQQTIGMREIGFIKPKPDTFFYVGMAGTSMATPHVSGLIGLMLSYGIPKKNVRKILRTFSKDLGSPGYDTLYGFGRIDAFSSLGGEDTIPPLISNTLIWNDTNFLGPFPTYSNITDLFGLKRKLLFYKFNQGEWESIPPCDSILNKFIFLIPSVNPNTFIRYYIKAEDLRGNISCDPPYAPNITYGFLVYGTIAFEHKKEYKNEKFKIVLYDVSGRKIKNKEIKKKNIYFIKKDIKEGFKKIIIF